MNARLALLRSLGPRSHAIFIYEDASDRDRLLLDAALSRLEEGQGVSFLVEDPSAIKEGLRARARAEGIPLALLEGCEGEGRLKVMDAREFLSQGPRIDDYLRLLRELCKGASEEGRGSWLHISDFVHLLYRGYFQEVVKAEKLLAERLEAPMAVVCCYRGRGIERLDPEGLIRCLKLHSHAIFPGIALRLGDAIDP